MTDRDLIAAIRQSVRDRGYPPSVTELSKQFGVGRATIHLDLNRLVEQGKIRREPNIARGITIVEDK